ncbi:NFATC2-interacting protein-like [Diadema antillarum]|uniref:NFATC2-interacting protein-like n=1 Tax=Diadema antillarum TaxID=105358 RepID=UPI003A86CF9D
MAQKRRKADLSNVPTCNLFSAFTDDGVLKARTFNIDSLDSDEEEDIEELKARIQNTSQSHITSSKDGKMSRAKKRRNYSNNDDDDDDDDVVTILSPSTGAENPTTTRNRDSPSPPPPTQLDDMTVMRIQQNSRRAVQVFRNLESQVSNYHVTKAISEMEGIMSPVMTSPTELVEDAHTPGPRETITVKVRTRVGLTRYEKYPMDQSFGAIFEDLARLSSVEKKCIRVTRKGEDVSETDTPRNISLHVADILDYVVVDGQAAAISYSLLDEEDFVMIRIRTREKNSGVTKRIAKMEPIGRVLEEFAASQKTTINSFRFMFDGEVITPDSTPQDLDMSEENVIDATKCL